MTVSAPPRRRAGHAAGWLLIGGALLGGCIFLSRESYRFGYDVLVRDMPVFWLAGGLVIAGLIFLALPVLLTQALTAGTHRARGGFALMVLTGLAMRLVLISSEPALEDDYQRYLWDGAVTAHGLNPYAVAPADAAKADPETSALGRLARESGLLIGRVNHPELRTLYPPVAQGAFALAYLIEPWSLVAWRAVILGFDIATLALIVAALGVLGRAPLWAALYWWNPVAIKELYNSAHMEGLLVCFLMLALVMSLRKRPLWSTVGVALAAGTKIWPVLFLPLVWRPLLAEPRKLAIAVTIAGAAGLLFAAPILMAGLDQTSGFVAYAEKWRTNSVLTPGLENLARYGLELIGTDAMSPAMVARALVATLLGALALGLAVKLPEDDADLVERWLVLAGAMFLLSPAQFPWYFLWVLPFMALRPVWSLFLATATLPLYYSAFHFMSRDALHIFSERIVWLVWAPVWLGLLIEFGRPRRLPSGNGG